MGAVEEDVAPLCLQSPPLPHTQLQVKGTGLPKLCPGREESGKFWPLWAQLDGRAGRLGPVVQSQPPSKEKEHNSKAGGS